MTIPSTARKAGPLLGTGAQTAWPFTFKVFAAADIAVTIANSAGTETPLVLGTDYSVTLNPNQDTSPGGTVTYPISGTPLAVGSKLSIVGDIDYDQPLDLPSGGNFSPLALENELDRVVMQIQQLSEESDRAVRVPVTSDADGTLPVPEAQKILGWDINGTGLQNYDIPALFSGVVYADWVADTFAGNGTQTVFVLQRSPGALGNCDVSVDGQTYVPNVDFSLSGATLTFTVAPTAGAEILVRYGSAATQVSSTFSTESQTATAGQTVFALNNLLYSPGANALAVYVNGLRMVSGVDFLESNVDEVTFTSGLTLGDEVLFIAGRTINESIGAEAVSYLPAGASAVATNVQAKLRESVSVKDFGAKGDGVTDDTAAVLAGVASLKAMGGGTLFFPQGTYKVTSEILIDSAAIRFVGTGRRKVYPGLFSPTVNTVSTIMPVHSSTAAVRFFNATINTASTFSAEGINFATLETGAMPTCCFGFDGSGNFHRDYTFDRVGIHGFTSAFDTYNTGGDTAFGLFKAINCAINRNGYIARNLTGQWNGFVFEKNEAGQNLTGGLDIKAQAASIRQNSMEGQPNTIKVTGIYRGVTIAENYFELNSGAYCVQLRETSNAIIQGNYWQNITATEPLSLVACVGTKILDRISPSCDASFDLGSPNNALNPIPRGSATAAFFLDASMVQNNMQGLTEFGGYQVTAPAGPHFSIPNSAGLLYTTSGTGLTSATKTGLSLPTDTYVGVAFAISYESEPALPPRFELRVNSTNTQGYTNAIFYNFSRATQGLKNKTVLYYGVVRATALVSTFQLFIYPYGLSPAAGLNCYLSAYTMYDLGTTLSSVSNVGAAIQAFIPETHVQRVTAAPTVGTWPVGYKLNARAPAAGSFEGWICTTAGTPGTWKTFGAITP